MDNLFKFRIKALALIAILLVSAVSASAQIDTVAIIDAGSSGSRLYVYAVDASKKTVDCIYPSATTPKDNLKGEELAKIPNNRDSVRAFLNDMTAKFPNKGGKPKELYVLATAGMRQEEGTRDTRPIYGFMTDGDSIFNRYKLQYAMTISGQYEGLYAWIAANYDAKTLPGQQGATGPVHGILEVGGASMQIAFVPQTVDVQSSEKISEKTTQLPVSVAADIIQRGALSIYSKSYLGGGLNEFHKGTLPIGGTVISGLEKIKAACTDTPFYGIGWAFGGLLKETDTKFKNRIDYVTNIRKALNSKEGEEINTVPLNSTWTKGAAFDIVINKHAPVEFDYSKQN